MSLIRQMGLLLLATLLLAFVGSTWVSTTAARDTLQTQLQLKNADAATSLALLLSQQRGDVQTMELMLAAQFDTGFFQRITLRPVVAGRPALVHEVQRPPLRAPRWFVAALPIESVPGIAQVSDGWRALGTLEVVSHTGTAHDDLWEGAVRSATTLAIVGVLGALFAALLLGRIRLPLDRAVAQAQSLERGEYVTVEEPTTPEMARLTRAMNSMVDRLKLVFEGQAEQVEALRQKLSCDPGTGVANRAGFLARLDAALHAEEGRGLGGLVILRMLDLAALNREAGHAATDRMILAVAQVLQSQADESPGGAVGRLNGSDFALLLPAAGDAEAAARNVVDTLRGVLATVSTRAAVVAGALELQPGAAMAAQLAAADQALARAESSGPFAVESTGAGAAGLAGLGEGAWRRRLHDALQDGDSALQLAEYPVRGQAGQLLHLECPLRVRLDPGAAAETAARWLPLALRSRLTAEIDARAVALALRAIQADGVPRGINVAPASLGAAFTNRLQSIVAASPRAARSLWIEVHEIAAIDQVEALQALGAMLRPLGVRLGLEHVGQRVGRIESLFDLGLDYVKLDAALGRGIGAMTADAAQPMLVRGLATLLHGRSLQVIAEGVADAADARVLWDCGVDGLTGPWVSATR